MYFAAADPKFLPNLVDLPEAQRDFDAWKKLRNQALAMLTLAKQFDDTLAALGSDAYRASLDIYDHLGKAADRNVPGAKAAHDELKPFFEKSKEKEEGLAD